MTKQVGRIEAPDWFPAAYQAFLESGSYDEGRVLAACKAAQVAVLRETADELDSFAGRLDGPAAVVARSCASIVRGKSRDMEAGAGQTGEGNA